jgi:hypothetical protein
MACQAIQEALNVAISTPPSTETQAHGHKAKLSFENQRYCGED